MTDENISQYCFSLYSSGANEMNFVHILTEHVYFFTSFAHLMLLSLHVFVGDVFLFCFVVTSIAFCHMFRNIWICICVCVLFFFFKLYLQYFVGSQKLHILFSNLFFNFSSWFIFPLKLSNIHISTYLPLFCLFLY